RPQEGDRLGGGEACNLRGARAGRERRVEEVDVEREENGPLADPLAHGARVPVRPECAQLLARDHREPSARASARSPAENSEPRIPACTEAAGSSSPSSTARLKVVPWK